MSGQRPRRLASNTKAETGQHAPGPAPAGVNPSAGFNTLVASLADIRTNLRQWSAGIGAVATAVLTGVGWTQADRLFPLAGPSWVPWVAGLSAGAALVAAVYVLVSLFAAQTRIIIGNEYELERYKISRNNFRPGEKELVKKALADQAAVEEAPRLADVELRAQRLHRIASRLKLRNESELAEVAENESTRLADYVGLAELRVVLMLLERRARNVTRLMSWTALAILVSALGVAGLFVAANYSQGARDKAWVVTHCIQELQGTGLASKCAKLIP